MSTHTEAHDSSRYYVPHSSHWPIVGSVGLFSLMVGAVSVLNDWAGAWAFIPGALIIAALFIGWFATVIGENQRGMFNMDVDRSFRMGMIWFIMSEVLFFAAFFGVLF
jgi:cytochrome c oxidase subunit 3